MNADNVIMLVKCLSNMLMPVCRFTIGILGQDRGQRSWKAKLLNSLNFCTIYVFKHKKETRYKKVLMCICVNKIMNNGMLRHQISENKNQSNDISQRKQS